MLKYATNVTGAGGGGKYDSQPFIPSIQDLLEEAKRDAFYARDLQFKRDQLDPNIVNMRRNAILDQKLKGYGQEYANDMVRAHLGKPAPDVRVSVQGKSRPYWAGVAPYPGATQVMVPSSERPFWKQFVNRFPVSESNLQYAPNEYNQSMAKRQPGPMRTPVTSKPDTTIDAYVNAMAEKRPIRQSLARAYAPTRALENLQGRGLLSDYYMKNPQAAMSLMDENFQKGYHRFFQGSPMPTDPKTGALAPPKFSLGLESVAAPMTFNPYGPNKANVAPMYTKVDPARYTNTAQYPWQYQGNKFVNVNHPGTIARTAPGIMRGAGAAMAPVAAIGSVAEMAPHWSDSAEEYGYNPNNTAGSWAQSEAAKMKNAPWYKKPVHGLNAMTGQAASGLQNAYKGYKGAYETGGVPGVMGQVSSDANQFLTNTLEGIRGMANRSGLTYRPKPQTIAPAIGSIIRQPEAGRAIEYAARAPEREQNSRASQQRAQNYAASAWSGQPQQQSKLPKFSTSL